MSKPSQQKPIHQCIKDKDPICVNCRYYAHLVGAGLGIRCSYNYNKEKDKLPASIPSRYHSCEHFTYTDRR